MDYDPYGMIRELFWRSSIRLAVIDVDGYLILTSKFFRDSFPELFGHLPGDAEKLVLDSADGGPDYFRRLSSLPPGERFSFRMGVSLSGARSVFAVETASLECRKGDKRLFLTEWIHESDADTCSAVLSMIEQKYRNLQENLPVGIYRADEEGTLQTANSALIRMMGFKTFEDLQNVRLRDVWVDPSQRDRMISELRRNGAVLNYQVNVRRANGDELIASFDARGTFDTDGKLLYFDAIVQDITDRVMATRELERLARTDSLTGLHNRQYLMERLEREFERIAGYGGSLSVMLIDLDHFKEVNDTYGHLAGDEVLSATARIMGRSLREADFAGRYGGEEFCVVLPGTSRDGALILAERLRSEVELNLHRMEDGKELAVTCSIGVGQTCGGSMNKLLADADTALYAAKGKGRNRVEPGRGVKDTPERRVP